MPRTDLERILDQIESRSVGFGPIFRDFSPTTSNYPPHNIVRVSDTEFYIELALAGFGKEDITVEMCQGQLTITGMKSQPEDEKLEYQHRGISKRSFSKTFRVAEYFEVSNAEMKDGILVLDFTKNIPEEAKPKLITIA